MSRGVNKVILIGRLGQNPEVRFMPNGSPVANLSLATSETWRDKQSGENQERTEWHRRLFRMRCGSDCPAPSGSNLTGLGHWTLRSQ